MKIKECEVCAHEFKTPFGRQKYCSAECAEAARKIQAVARYQREKKSREKKPRIRKVARDWLKESAACGMSYGKYRAAIEQLGKTYEELLAARKGESDD